MKTILFTVLALGAFSVAANAEPVKLGKQQMSQITAGAINRTTTNPGGNTGGCSNNPNCVTVATNPAGHPPPGQQ